MIILVTGANGQLGKSIKSLVEQEKKSHSFVFVTRNQLDLSSPSNIKNYFEIYLKSTLEERIKRDKKKIYLTAINGEKKNLIDVFFSETIEAKTSYDNPTECRFGYEMR